MTPPMKSPKKLSANALITALFVMTLVAIAAMAMSLRLRLDIKRTDLSQDQILRINEFRYLSTMHFIDFANQSALANQTEGAEEQILPRPISVPHPIFGTLSGALIDEESKFNINSLTGGDKGAQEVFSRLIKNVFPGAPSNQGIAISREIMKTFSLRGTEKFVDINEISSLLGDFKTKLSPYLTALPENKLKLHPISARPEVLAAFYPNVSLGEAQNLVNTLQRATAKQKQQMLQEAGINVDKEGLTPHYLRIDLTIEDRKGHSHFHFSRLAEMDQKSLSILDENWF